MPDLIPALAVLSFLASFATASVVADNPREPGLWLLFLSFLGLAVWLVHLVHGLPG